MPHVGDVGETDEDGGGGDEKYEINSMGEPARAERLLLRLRWYRNIQNNKALRKTTGNSDEKR